MKVKLSLLILFVCTLRLQAQDSLRFTLQQAVDYTVQNSIAIKNSQIDERIAKQKVNELTGLGTPQIAGSAELNDFLELPTSFIPAAFFGGEPGTFAAIKFGQQYTASAGITASQLLFDGSYLAGLKASKTYLDLNRKISQQTKVERVVAVSKAYNKVLVYQEQVNSFEANLVRIKKLRDDTKAMLDAGMVEQLDYDQYQILYNNLNVQKQSFERGVQLGYIYLKMEMGMDVALPLALTDKLDESKSGEISLPEKADPQKRIEFDILQTSERLQEIDLKRYRSSYLPSLAAYGSLSANASRDEFNIFNTNYRWYPTAIIGARLTIPIWDGLQKNSQIQQAKLRVERAKNDLKQFEQFASSDYSSAKTALANTIASLESSKKNLELAKEVVRVTKIKYDNGIGSSFDLVSSESSLKEAQTSYYNSLYESIVSKIEVDRALGNIK